jgi:hypothetical protein
MEEVRVHVRARIVLNGSAGNFKFAGTPTVPLAIAQRTDVLLNKMRAAEETIDKLAGEAGELKKVLKGA